MSSLCLFCPVLCSLYSSHSLFFFLQTPPPTKIYTLSLHDALPIYHPSPLLFVGAQRRLSGSLLRGIFSSPKKYSSVAPTRSEEHTSELQSRLHLVCRLLLEKKKKIKNIIIKHLNTYLKFFIIP